MKEIFKEDMIMKSKKDDRDIFQPAEFFMCMKDNPTVLNDIVQRYLLYEGRWSIGVGRCFAVGGPTTLTSKKVLHQFIRIQMTKINNIIANLSIYTYTYLNILFLAIIARNKTSKVAISLLP